MKIYIRGPQQGGYLVSVCVNTGFSTQRFNGSQGLSQMYIYGVLTKKVELHR